MIKTNYSQNQYSLRSDGAFVIESYSQSPPFSNFFPGIAGLWGIPMWVFYVNRGQCISSFGIESKDKSILEFQPANKAYRLTSSQGFRTFLKITSGAKTFYYEPFQTAGLNQFQTKQSLSITSHDLTLTEHNLSLGLKTQVNYFTLPEEPYSALVRQVAIENVSKKKYGIELIDGLPMIIPYGMTDWLVKNMSRTVEAWVMVRNHKAQAPFYQLKVVVSDRPAVTHIREGNFYFAFEQGSQKHSLLPALVESAKVFGNATDFSFPQAFFTNGKFSFPKEQETANRTPSAMSYARFPLNPKASKHIVSLSGYAFEESQVGRIVKQALAPGFIEKKSHRNKELIAGIKDLALMNSSSQVFNQYCGQNFLDNVLRGGLPVSLRAEEGNVVLNVFSRKHGDPERDYNFFMLSPTFYSQGNGNYRDVNQNRRSDIWINPDLKDQHIVSFLNLLQADGYNPLVVKGLTFSVEDRQALATILDSHSQPESRERLQNILTAGFHPGELLRKITQKEILLKSSAHDFLQKVIGICHKNESADHGEGYWSDHWTYNLDLIESYLIVYPENLGEILLEKKIFSFYFDSYYILPRDRRYILTPQGVRQYHCVFDASKEIKAKQKGNKLRVQNGEGAVYQTSLAVKLLCLLANKIATLDPHGIGIEMEADKPNWYDALNGLPGLFGSSVCETFEVKRLAQFLLRSIETLGMSDGYSVKMFEELAVFLNELSEILGQDRQGQTANGDTFFSFWRKSNDSKEKFRQRVRFGISGDEKEMPLSEITGFLNLVVEKADIAIEGAKAFSSKGLYPSYFIHEVARHEVIDVLDIPLETSSSSSGVHPPEASSLEHLTHVRPTAFKIHALPFFLEGFVHGLRVEDNIEKAKALYAQVKKSALFDKKLKMYKVNADLSKESEEIGRTRIFPSGWLENESVWLHMEYKYLLELLRLGLYEEFYGDFSSCLIPFLDPQRYGRSVLENSSFIVSSAHEDQSLHGRGFVARLSGSTAEFLHICLLMNTGARPFELDSNHKLTLSLRPALAAWLFTKKDSQLSFCDREGIKRKALLPKNSYAFLFMGKTLIVYHNPHRKNTFGPDKAVIQKIILYSAAQQKPVILMTEAIPPPLAHEVRQGKFDKIDVFWG